MRVEVQEGAEKRSYLFIPPDPIWAAAGALQLARKRLQDFDPRLNIWWSPSRRAWDYKRDAPAEMAGRWRIVEWMPNHGNWHTAFYWEGPNGEFRDFEPLEPILQRLGRALVPTDVASKLADEAEAERNATKRREFAEACNELHEDLSARHNGVRQTFAPGYIRRRNVKQSDLQDTNHQRFLRDHKKKWDGSSG